MNLVQALYLNNEVEPLNNVKVRQALCYAANRQEVLDMIADGKGTIIGSSMFPAFGKYYMPELADKYNQDIEKAKEVLQLISNKDCVIELLENSGDISIKIGEENYIPEAKDCSVITAEYFLGGRPIGSVGLIGPQRINYSKVVTIMSQVMKELNKSLKDQEY